MNRIITVTKNRNHKDTIQRMSTKQKDSCPALFPIPNEVSAVVNYTLHLPGTTESICHNISKTEGRGGSNTKHKGFSNA